MSYPSLKEGISRVCHHSVLAALLALLVLSALWSIFSMLPLKAEPGTIIVPDDYPTIQAAINHAVKGDMIYVRNGTYFENIVVNETVSLIGEHTLGTIIDGGHVGVVVRILASDASIKGFTVRNSGYEPYDYGILITSSGTKVADNEIIDNCWGIGLASPGNACIISGNSIGGNEHSGGGSWGGGIVLIYADHNTIVGNTISCFEDTGIYFLGASSHNKILGNTLMNHFLSGIHLSGSNNIINHNNFMELHNQVIIEEGINTWDDGYPFGGNFWSDYAGADLFSGSYQNETGSDGIGDTPYPINENNIDNYPLMQPYGSIKNLDTDSYYVTIQSAIDATDTLDGHTIFVSSGTYYEHLVVNRSISLVGESKETTIIHGRSIGNVINITASNVKLNGFTIRNSGSPQNYGIYIFSAGNDISYNIIKNNHFGIYIDNCGNNTIFHNAIFNNIHGIYVAYSSCINASNNNVSSNNGFGMVLASSANCNIAGNIASNNSHGVYVDHYSSNNTVSGNTVVNNFYGVCLYSSSSNVIFHNNLFNNTQQAWSLNSTNGWDNSGEGNYWSNYNGTDTNGDGIGDVLMPIDDDNQDHFPLIHPYGSIRNVDTDIFYLTMQSAINASETLDAHTLYVSAGKYYEHVVVSKSVSLVGENRETTIIDGTHETGDVITITTSNVAIRSFTIQKSSPPASSSGICLQSSNCTTIEDNIVIDNEKGITLYNSHNIIIACNAISSNTGGSGVYLSGSLSNWIGKNNITDNVLGISLSESGNNTIIHNWIAHNDYEGIKVWGLEANCNTIAHNNVSNNGFNHTPELDGIHINLSSNNTIYSNAVAMNAGNGLSLTRSSNNYISGNEIFSNDGGAGISLSSLGENSTSNIIITNTLADNEVGIYLNRTDRNSIYHNNFLNNTEQLDFEAPLYENTWDNGCEGNYWSDYHGTDLDGDGIGDTSLPWKGVDHYPLMNPYWNPADINHDLKVDIFDIVLACGAYGATPSDPNWNAHCDIAEPCGIISIYDIVMIAGSYGEEWGHSQESPIFHTTVAASEWGNPLCSSSLFDTSREHASRSFRARSILAKKSTQSITADIREKGAENR